MADINPIANSGVSGTAGTADTTGTAQIVALGANPATGALYVHDLSGASGTTTVQMVSGTLNVGTVVIPSGSIIGTVLNTGTNINVFTGTQQLLTTVSNLTNGSINVLTGTQQLLTTVSNLTNGSINVLTGTVTSVTALAVGTVGGKAASGVAAVANPVQIAGTDVGGTIYSPLINTAGNLQIHIANTPVVAVSSGTQQTLGTVGLVNGLVTGTITTGSLSNIAMINAGTHVHPSGTLTTGSLSNVAMLNAGTVVTASGTVTLLSTVTTLSNLTTGSINVLTGTQQLLTTVSNLTNGSINLLTGTVTSVTNLAGGTVQINPVPVPATLTFGTLGTAGGSFFATISAASGAGTKHYISGVDIVQQSGTADVRVLAGSAIQGTGVLAAGFFAAPSAGISNRFTPAFATGTNSELIYHFVGAGTAFIRVSYWKGI